ncbi:YjjG family noncanonical pyrimidine nucleotidase [Persicobacter psychrovividus]|uniref:Noncanonical pyrimidine nucleotidase, YjjG family protein n=1 Tax=Persicobacter psychrovividus TaxID=387638 RepID=A0ABN6L5K9_9BACT|nr:noncanonical pyrimidine nucleotidase, YjjG family protein [Persicobacter psychrovividus]
MKKYKYVLFDLDHTLWDFEKNSTLVLEQLFTTHKLHQLGNDLSFERFIEEYTKVNHQLWQLYNKDEISKEELRDSRFEKVLTNLGVEPDRIPQGLGLQYLEKSPHMPHVFPNTYETLDYLKGRYPMAIVTNGFEEVQHIKMASSKLTDYFKYVVTSELAGYKKPHKGIFNHTLELLGATAEECIMIGDSFESDIEGAKKAKIDHVYFNPNKIKHRKKIQHEIHNLIELKELL